MKHHGLYDNSPTIKGEEKGGQKVVTTPKKEHGDGPVDKGVKDEEGFEVSSTHHLERLALHHKHMHEHMQLHHKHETEHHHHKGSLSELHKKHHEERKKLHEHHEHEQKTLMMKHDKEDGLSGGKQAGAGGATGEPIEKVERNAK